MYRALTTGALGLLCLQLACSGSDSSSEPPGSTDTGILPSTDGGIQATDSGFPDGGFPDSGFPDSGFADSGVAPVAKVCADLGLTPQPFKTASTTFEFGDVAGDFTVNQLDGSSWNLLDNWSGCESYVFINYIFIPVRTTHRELWTSDVGELIRTPVNSHFFFTSTELEATRRVRVEEMKDRIEAAIDLAYPDPAANAAQKARFHYVVDDPAQIEGSVGTFYSDYFAYANSAESAVDLGDRGNARAPLPYFIGIDRDQKWDSGGSPAQAVGATAALRMASYLPDFYNHKAGIRDAQALESGVTTVMLLDRSVTERQFDETVTLPSASDMANFDTMEFDVMVNCPHRNVFACSEWDRIARIDLCDGPTCDNRREVIRWITPYWRRGERRWVIDASALLSLVRDGGATTFRITFGPTWERATSRDVRIALRLDNRGQAVSSQGAVFAFSGGNFNAEYNNRAPFEFSPPTSATKAELVVILSGHGQESGTNCAEWCDHRHRFSVNGMPVPEIRHEGSIGSLGGCGPAAAQGVSPGQWGNWAPERAYWCPGLPVDHIRVDITDLVQFGQVNQLTYSANFRGQVGTTGGGNISLSTYVVWYQ